jgi:hypothetical protein
MQVTQVTRGRLKCGADHQELNPSFAPSPPLHWVTSSNLSQPLHGWCKSIAKNIRKPSQHLPATVYIYNPWMKLQIWTNPMFRLIYFANPLQNSKRHEKFTHFIHIISLTLFVNQWLANAANDLSHHSPPPPPVVPGTSSWPWTATRWWTGIPCHSAVAKCECAARGSSPGKAKW